MARQVGSPAAKMATAMRIMTPAINAIHRQMDRVDATGTSS